MITLADFNLKVGDFFRVTIPHWELPTDGRTMRVAPGGQGVDLWVYIPDGSDPNEYETVNDLPSDAEIEMQAAYCSHREGASMPPGRIYIVDPRNIEKLDL